MRVESQNSQSLSKRVTLRCMKATSADKERINFCLFFVCLFVCLFFFASANDDRAQQFPKASSKGCGGGWMNGGWRYRRRRGAVSKLCFSLQQHRTAVKDLSNL